MGKVKTYFQSDSTDGFEVIDGTLFLDGVKVADKHEMKEFREWLAGEVCDGVAEEAQEYDFDEMDFDIDEARNGRFMLSFRWSFHPFGCEWWSENHKTEEGRAEINKMIREYERVHGKDS